MAWLEAAGSETILISPWTRTEFASAAGIMARRRDITAELQLEGLSRFARFVDTRLALEPLVSPDFDCATRWISNYDTGLRARDALHLDVCARLNAHLSTADEMLTEAGTAVGIGVHRVRKKTRD